MILVHYNEQRVELFDPGVIGSCESSIYCNLREKTVKEYSVLISNNLYLLSFYLVCGTYRNILFLDYLIIKLDLISHLNENFPFERIEIFSPSFFEENNASPIKAISILLHTFSRKSKASGCIRWGEK